MGFGQIAFTRYLIQPKETLNALVSPATATAITTKTTATTKTN